MENSAKLGEFLLEGLKKICQRDFITDVRGRGLFIAVELVEDRADINGWDFCLRLKEHGLITRPTHQNKVRYAISL